MNELRRVTLGWPAAAAASVALLAIGAGGAYGLLRGHSTSGSTAADHTVPPAANGTPPTGSPALSTDAGTPGSTPDVVVTLTPEAVARGHIVVSPVVSANAGSGLRLPAVVEPNTYHQVMVTPLVSGRVTRVQVELGQRVQSGQLLAEVFSPELAEVQTRYISARATLLAHEQELRRVEQLVTIGAASRQELEMLHAEHAGRSTEVESTRSRLELLGLSASVIDNLAPGQQLSAVTAVLSPIAGVVTERTANVGVNVDPTMKLFTVTDLSTVWVVADLYEKDFAGVPLGTQATVATAAYPDAEHHGTVSYIDPQLSAETRTARVRVEVNDPRHELRLGMYATMTIPIATEQGAAMIPRSAVQNVGDRTVVYLADATQAGRFSERDVRLGAISGDRVAVRDGLRVGDQVVGEGSFLVRAERERLGVRSSSAPTTMVQRNNSTDPVPAKMQTATVVVGTQGYEPATLNLRAGIPAQITFLRTTDATCGTEVVFPSMNIRRTLPLNTPVVVEFTPAKADQIAFVCGMNMLHGTVVVQ